MTANGADVNAVDNRNSTIFICACRHRSPSFLQELADKVLSSTEARLAAAEDRNRKLADSLTAATSAREAAAAAAATLAVEAAANSKQATQRAACCGGPS